MLEFIKANAASSATVFFFLFFCSVIYSVFKKGQQKKFEHYSQIPLNDEVVKTQEKSVTKRKSSKKK